MANNRNRTPAELELKKGSFGENRHAWVRVTGLEYILYINESPERPEVEGIPSVTLSISPPGKRPMNLHLIHYTAAELAAIRELFEEAFDIALIHCIALDAEADRAFKEDGDDSNTRLYRAVPEIKHRLNREENDGDSD